MNSETDRTRQINWLTLQCYDLAQQDGSAHYRVANWESVMDVEGKLPGWYDESDHAFMIKQLSEDE